MSREEGWEPKVWAVWQVVVEGETVKGEREMMMGRNAGRNEGRLRKGPRAMRKGGRKWIPSLFGLLLLYPKIDLGRGCHSRLACFSRFWLLASGSRRPFCFCWYCRLQFERSAM